MGGNDGDSDSLLDNGIKKNGTGTNIANSEELLIQLQAEFEAMIASVEKYKGFYIGRYETGTGYVVKQNVDPIEIQNWYSLYQKQKDMYEGSSSVVSSMVYGAQWDQTLLWFYTDLSTRGYITNSTGKGNYSGSKVNTGMTENADVKNIYDMAGNVNEWTQEVYHFTSDEGARTLRRSTLRLGWRSGCYSLA